MSDLNLYLDVTNKKLVCGQYNAVPFAMPKQFFESTVNISLMLLRANPDGGLATPYTVVDPTGYSMTIAVGSFVTTTGTKLASQNSWTISTTTFTGTLNLNTAQMITAMTSDTINKTFEIQWGSGNDTYQTPIVISGEVITAGSPDPNDYTDTEFADAMEGRLADSYSIDVVRAGDIIDFDLIPKSGGRVTVDSGGVDIDDELLERVDTTLVESDAKTLTVDAKYRIIQAVYTMNAAAANGTATLALDTTDREEGDLAYVHFNASSIGYDVEVTVDSTSQLVFETDAAQPLSLNARFVYSGSVWNLIEARWEDGTLAAGDFTPAYPDPSSGANETAGYTTTVTAAGETELTFTEGKANHTWFFDIQAGAGTYTRTIIAKRPTTTDEGAPFHFLHFTIAASANPTVEIYDEGPLDSSSDDVLKLTLTGSSKRATEAFIILSWDAVNAKWAKVYDSGGDARGFHPIWLPARALDIPDTDPATAAATETSTNARQIRTYDFATAVDKYVQADIDTPEAWNGGTILAQFVWGATSGSGDVIWAAQGSVMENNESWDAAWGTAISVTDTLLNTDRVHRSDWTAAITLDGAAAGNWASLRIYRNGASGSDTFTGTAKLLGVKLLFQLDAGSDD